MVTACRFGVTERETAAGAGLRTTNPPSDVASVTMSRERSQEFGAEGFSIARDRLAEIGRARRRPLRRTTSAF